MKQGITLPLETVMLQILFSFHVCISSQWNRVKKAMGYESVDLHSNIHLNLYLILLVLGSLP